jgi:regulator of protease activity HflC (stomatin/prohibitin superfamily)
MNIVFVLIAVAVLVLLLLGSTVRVITQFERGVVLRFGQLRDATRGPGLTLITPIADRLHKVNMQIVTMPVPAQEGITRDNVTVRVDAVVYYRVVDPVKVVVDVQNYNAASARSPRPPCGRSSARATSTTCCPTGSDSTRASNS